MLRNWISDTRKPLTAEEVREQVCQWRLGSEALSVENVTMTLMRALQDERGQPMALTVALPDVAKPQPPQLDSIGKTSYATADESSVLGPNLGADCGTGPFADPFEEELSPSD